MYLVYTLYVFSIYNICISRLWEHVERINHRNDALRPNMPDAFISSSGTIGQSGVMETQLHRLEMAGMLDCSSLDPGWNGWIFLVFPPNVMR